MSTTMRYTDAELLKLLDETESDFAERKESWKGDAPEKARQAICAFANDLSDHRKPGVLFVGARDNGTPSLCPPERCSQWATSSSNTAFVSAARSRPASDG